MEFSLKASALIELQDWDKAVTCVDSAIESDPAYDDSWYQKARILSVQKNIEDSLDSLLVAVSLEKENKKRAKSENEFENIRNLERFKKITM